MTSNGMGRESKRSAIRTLAEFGSPVAVGGAFDEVESALVLLGTARGLPVTQGLQALALLDHHGMLFPEVRPAYENLMRMRNEVWRNQVFRQPKGGAGWIPEADRPDPELVKRYVKTAFDLADVILKLVPEPTAAPAS